MTTANVDIGSLRAHFQTRQREILALTRALVEVESPSGDAAGSNAVVSLLASAARTIGAVDSIERVTSENFGEHLRIKAFSSGRNASRKPILILGHTDTVHPRGSLQERPWRVEGNRAYGPGVFDMKANCALAIEVIRACAQLNLTLPQPLTVLLTCDEEKGSVSGRSLVEAEAKRAHATLVLEPPANGRVKTARKGTATFIVTAHGRAAHAGLEPEKGASAVLEIARQIQQLHELNDPSRGISVTVGTVRGGTTSNVVPAEAHAEVDVRFTTNDDAVRIEKQISELRAFDDRVRLVVTGGINRPPLERTADVASLFEQARNIAAACDYELGEAQVGGASDGNFAAAVGSPVLDGLGINGDGAHATHEHIVIDDIPLRGALLAGLLLKI